MFDMVDVCVGPMTIKQGLEEVKFYMRTKKPERLIMDIQKTDNGYVIAIWIPSENF